MSKVRIKSAGERFRRAGITATRDGVVYDEKDLTKKQIEAIEAEPRMSIQPEKDDSGKSGSGKK